LLSPAQLAAARRGQSVAAAATLFGDDRVRLLGERVRAQGQTLVVVVGQSLEERDAALGNLAGVLLLGGPAALLFSSFAGYLLTGAALRPVEAMRRRAASISVAELDQRLSPGGANDELGRLGRTLNDMLGRIDASVASERGFVSDASHELRTPLAILRTELELIARERPTGHALQTAAGSAIDETDRLSRLADDLLLLARAGDHQLALRITSAPVSGLLHQAADRMRRQAASTGIEIGVDAPPGVTIEVDTERIGQALDNLLANALRYAGTSVQLSARLGGTSVELHVTDDGPGFPPEFLRRAFERFARADRGRTEDGVGLGLAIVRTIAETHGGDARAANRRQGGSDVWITLPLRRA
jgi:signal transduction histidine kinase